jgi:hypothetical protein
MSIGMAIVEGEQSAHLAIADFGSQPTSMFGGQVPAVEP